MLDFEGDVEATFGVHFQVSYEVFGELKLHEVGRSWVCLFVFVWVGCWFGTNDDDVFNRKDHDDATWCANHVRGAGGSRVTPTLSHDEGRKERTTHHHRRRDCSGCSGSHTSSSPAARASP